MQIQVAVITTDKTAQTVATLTSLLNQSRRPDSLMLIENTLSGTRVVPNASTTIWALLDAFTRAGTEVSVHLRHAKGLVDNRAFAESKWLMQENDEGLYLISDDDHVYPYDYLERAHAALLDAEDAAVYATLVETWLTEDCTDPSSRYGEILEQLRAMPQMTSGGSAVYNQHLLGQYLEVLRTTSGAGEDWVWRERCFKHCNAVRLPLHDEGAIHLAKWSPYRWGSFVLQRSASDEADQ